MFDLGKNNKNRESNIVYKGLTYIEKVFFFDFLFLQRFIDRNVEFKPVMYKEGIYYLKDFSPCRNPL